jgi:hypothetical protein
MADIHAAICSRVHAHVTFASRMWKEMSRTNRHELVNGCKDGPLRRFAAFLRGNVGLSSELRAAQREVMVARLLVLIGT